MQKVGVLEWLETRLPKDVEEDGDGFVWDGEVEGQTDGGTRKRRDFFKYESRSEVTEAWKKGTVMSAVTIKEFEKEAWIVHGKRGTKVRCVRLGYNLGEASRKECGMAFLKTKLLSDEDMELSEEDLKMVIDAPCLLLPHVPSNRDFKGHCGMVFSD